MSVEVKLEIRDGKVENLLYKGYKIPINVEFKDLPERLRKELELALNILSGVPAGISIGSFLKGITGRQRAIIKVLANSGGWVSRKELAKGVSKELGKELDARELAGPLAGITRRCKREGLSLLEGRQEGGMSFWRLNPRFLKEVKDLLEEGEVS